jgi:hypothetical protein
MNSCHTDSRWKCHILYMFIKCSRNDVENRDDLVHERSLALRHLLRGDEEYLQTHQKTDDSRITTLHASKSGNNFSRSSHSCLVSWKHFKRADWGRLCCSDITNRFSASRSWSAHSRSLVVLFHLVATSRTMRRGLILLLIHALSRSAQIVGLLNIRFARFRNWCAPHQYLATSR